MTLEVPRDSSSLSRRDVYNEKANTQLGQNRRTASHLLSRDILYSLLLETERDSCLRCGKSLTPSSYSVEHIEEWLDSSDPRSKFFDLSNIDFVCKKCNSTYNRGRMDVRLSGIPLVKPTARPPKPIVNFRENSSHSTVPNFSLKNFLYVKILIPLIILPNIIF